MISPDPVIPVCVDHRGTFPSLGSMTCSRDNVAMPRHRNPGLTPTQRRLGSEYLADLNATEAAIRAGYKPTTAQEQAARLLSKERVQDAVAAGQAKRNGRLEITQDRVIAEQAKLAFADPRDRYQ